VAVVRNIFLVKLVLYFITTSEQVALWGHIYRLYSEGVRFKSLLEQRI